MIFFNLGFFSFDRFTSTHHASLTGSSEVVIALIELECDVNAKDKKGDKINTCITVPNYCITKI